MITKKQYLNFLDCPRYYYFNINQDNTNNNLDCFSEYLRKQSLSIRKLAYSYFGDYIYIPYNKDYNIMAKATEEALKNNQTIINATFIIDDIALIIDMLHNNNHDKNHDKNREYDIYEIKASTKNHQVNLDALMFEYYALSKISDQIHINRYHLLHVNKDYVFNGSIDIKEYFKVEEISVLKLFNISEYDINKELKSSEVLEEEYKEAKQEVFKEIDYVLGSIKNYKLSDKVTAESRCKRSHQVCSYFKDCFKDLPINNVFNLCNLQEPYKYYNKGCINYLDVYNSLSDKNILAKEQIDYTLNNKPLKLEKKVWGFINKLVYPIYHLDFETIQSLLPNVQGLTPIDIRITQYSIHKQSAIMGEAKHYKYLQESLYDNREEVASHLIKDLGKKGTILAYNASFEASRIRELAGALPSYKEALLNIANRILDLEEIFDNRSIYTKEMNGSASIKHVLPGLLGNNSYNEIDCQNGQDAISMYDELIHTDINSRKHKKLKKDLITYSTQDTYSMVLILNKIYDLLKLNSDKVEYYINTIQVSKSNSKEIINKLVDFNVIESPVITEHHFYIEDECDFDYSDIHNAYYKAAKMIIKEYK